jgi:Histidine kinase
MSETDALLRELNHRVKNNFQIIVSLMNLRKRMLPREWHEDIRFIEEHVQSMSVAYRLVYATGSIVDVSLSELIVEVLSGLRQIAALDEDLLRIEMPPEHVSLGLDPAIALALYLAVLLPPYLDQAVATDGIVTVTVGIVANLVTLTVRGDMHEPVILDFPRHRLMHAYAGQLGANILPATRLGEERLSFSSWPP